MICLLLNLERRDIWYLTNGFGEKQFSHHLGTICIFIIVFSVGKNIAHWITLTNSFLIVLYSTVCMPCFLLFTIFLFIHFSTEITVFK